MLTVIRADELAEEGSHGDKGITSAAKELTVSTELIDNFFDPVKVPNSNLPILLRCKPGIEAIHFKSTDDGMTHWYVVVCDRVVVAIIEYIQPWSINPFDGYVFQTTFEALPAWIKVELARFATHEKLTIQLS
jgi:hypothetical protein